MLISDIFTQGAVVHGFPDNRWTNARLASIIEGRFGIHYDHDHVGRLMQKLGLREPRARPVPKAIAMAASVAAAEPLSFPYQVALKCEIPAILGGDSD